MRESLMYGSVRGTRGNSRPYRDEGARQSWRDQPVQVLCSEGVATHTGPERACVSAKARAKRRQGSA